MKLLPQEIEVWYLIPGIRRELSKIFIKEYELSQKQVSDVLGLTESAVSQYLKSKRGNELKFNEEEITKIKDAAKKIMNDKKNTTRYLFELSIELRGTHSLCELHKKHDSSIEKKCNICMEK